MKPSSVINLFPDTCACGSNIDQKNIESFHIHQEIELPEIEMNVAILYSTKAPALIVDVL